MVPALLYDAFTAPANPQKALGLFLNTGQNLNLSVNLNLSNDPHLMSHREAPHSTRLPEGSKHAGGVAREEVRRGGALSACSASDSCGYKFWVQRFVCACVCEM